MYETQCTLVHPYSGVVIVGDGCRHCRLSQQCAAIQCSVINVCTIAGWIVTGIRDQSGGFAGGLAQAQWTFGQTCMAAMVLGGLPLMAMTLMVGAAGFSVPRIHDVSTDTVTPPEFVAAQQERSASQNTLVYGGEALAAQQLQAYPQIQPYQSASNARQTFDKALATVQQLGWRVIREDAAGGYIEAVEETRVFGFKDDVIIRITPSRAGSRVDARSVSRLG
ncbi:DUF1499 domain-containing protein [Endozoicomonas sp. ONNA2]|uniref:DUF1499 domain-containing protein n=1 Tax=Endozoicomonas sp. ONNA2 TaxID=2828741 RepID=UPI0021497518|nr:DUF1499 domain-containing protein [Endozoicomonas sp. ONNA2]